MTENSRVSLAARTFTWIVIVLGLTVLLPTLAGFNGEITIQYACYFLLALLASVLKVGWRSRYGVLSLNILFIFIGLIQLPTPHTMLMAGTAALAHAMAHVRRNEGRLEQALFSVGGMSLAVSMTDATLRWQMGDHVYDPALRLIAAGAVYFIASTFPAAAVAAMREGAALRKVWREHFFWMLPYYLGGAAAAGAFHQLTNYVRWELPVVALPVMYLLYRSYRLYLGRIEDRGVHAEEMASLHLRTIEALALAIDAKDHTTHDHLQRVQIYALAVGKEMGMSEEELEALRAASILHDIGKLAVPEHIISKPGRLTPEEFEKMKIHPVVGAEILERVQFPYDVVPVVRAHHEKWDGSGYPDGLKEEAIPLGARILAAVDCLDALASDRQYRKALPLDQAIGVVVGEAGRSYDPRVVEILARRYRDLEKKATANRVEPMKLSTDLKIEHGLAPAAGFAEAAPSAPPGAAGEPAEFLNKIAAARHEAQALFELAQNLGSSLKLDETLSVLAVRLKRLVPHDSIAVYLTHGDRLLPEFVSGDNFRLFAALEIPLGQGLSGWVAENSKPILNGNPSVEPGYLNDPTKFSTLRSTVAVPLEGLQGTVGVMALYATERDAFSRDHLRILLAISSKLALAVENALKFRQAETSATTDFMTELPNARSLFLHLDAEMARCRRQDSPLALIVCDLDGFKAVNDELGHLEGNRILRAVAKALRDNCREYDYVARMGGDEFVLVLPGLDAAEAAGRTERLRRAVSEAAWRTANGCRLGMSVGVSHFPADGSDAEELLAEADRRMYGAKQAARLRQAGPDALPANPWENAPHSIQ